MFLREHSTQHRFNIFTDPKRIWALDFAVGTALSRDRARTRGFSPASRLRSPRPNISNISLTSARTVFT
jgi:hypothetical protein